MSDDGPEWFAPKRYGYGAGLPISWQGWAVTLGFMSRSSALRAHFSAHRPIECCRDRRSADRPCSW